MKGVLSAHQPNFLPYLGFFDKMAKSDIFVIRDEVQFSARDWQHRNKIRVQGLDKEGNGNCKWVTVPVDKQQIDIKEIPIKTDTKVKNVPALQYVARQIEANYHTAPYFNDYFPQLNEILSNGHKQLIDLNMEIIMFLRDAFGLKTKIVKATELPGYEKVFDATGDLVNLCLAADASTYISGAGGKKYLNHEEFQKAGINLEFQNYKHPVYQQNFQGFAPYMASVDALFNVGGLPENSD